LTNLGKTQTTGSGFIAEISGEQWVYTNAHVIEGASRVKFNDFYWETNQSFRRISMLCDCSGSFKLEALVDDVGDNGNKENHH